jgi:nitrite reductase (NO-forming)
VVASHQIASRAFAVGGAFAIVALGWGGVVALRGGSWWGPLHAFLAGSVLMAISGAAQMFTITWSAAPAPRKALPVAQRWATAAGVAAVLVGMGSDNGALAVVGAITVAAGLILLGSSLVGSIRRSLLRRFDLASRFYLLAVTAGVVGVTLGGLMSGGAAGSRYGDLRLAHSRLNLVGLIGLTIVGTLPTILPTFARHKAVSGREAVAAWWIAVGAVVAMGAGVAWGEAWVGSGVVLAAIAMATVLAGVLGRLGYVGLRGRLAYAQVAIGCSWLVVWGSVDGVRLMLGIPAGPYAGWTAAAVVAGVGQVLLGSLAYLVPVLVGPHPRLGRNLDRTNNRPWIPLTLANVAGVALVAGWSLGAAAAAALWVVDFGLRLARLEWRDREQGD